MKKIFAILLVLVVVFSLAACKGSTTDTNTNGGTNTDNNSADTNGNDASDGSGDNAGTVSAKDTLKITVTQDRGTLDPMYMIGYDYMRSMRMVYDTLWDIDSDGNMVWVLATGIEYVEPTVWHIKLREGITFSNGNPFTAEDALFSILRGNNRVGEPMYLPELDMENSNVLDDYTVELIFGAYDLSYVAGMTSLVMFDVESFDEEIAATTPMGTGPYELVDYVINSHINLVARDGYWGEPAKIKNLNFMVLAEDAQRVNALQTGTTDISAVPFQDLEFVQSLDGITVDIRASAMSNAVFFNTSETRVFYDNADARKAVAYAIDREAIVDIAYSGFATPSRIPVSMGNIDWEDRFLDKGVYGDSYNVELARQLAESSGLVDKEILLINNGSSADVVICELIQANLRDIGVTVNVNSLDAGSWLSIVFDPTAFDMAINFTSVPSMTMAQNYSAWILYMNGGTYVTDPWPGRERYLVLIDGIMAMSDPAELSERYMELTELHVEAMIWYSLIDTQTANAYNSDIQGWAPMQDGNVNYAKLSWAA